MIRSNRRADRYALRCYWDKAALQKALERRPLPASPRASRTIWLNFGLFAPEIRPRPLSTDEQQARKAYHLARRGKPEAALRELDTMIARLKRHSADDLQATQFLTNVYLFAGAVGYMVCDEIAGACYDAAVERATYKVPALLVLGAIFLRLGRVDQARTAWDRALRIERERYADDEQRFNTLGQREALQDAKVELEKLEAMVAGLEVESAS